MTLSGVFNQMFLLRLIKILPIIMKIMEIIFLLNKYLICLGSDQLKLASKLPYLLFPLKPVLFMLTSVEVRW